MYGQICGSKCLMQRKKKAKQRWAIDETKARQCQTIERNILHLTKRRRISSSQWKPLVESWTFRCQQQCLAKTRGREYRETCSASATRKTKYACIVEADESTRKRLGGTSNKDHEDHIAGKGTNSLSHYNLVHEFIPMPQAMKILDAKAAVEKEKEKLEKYRHGGWRKSGKTERWSMKQRKRAKQYILLPQWIFVI